MSPILFAIKQWILFWHLNFYTKKQKSQWDEECIPYSGIPIMAASFKAIDCHHYADKNISAKRKWREQSGKKKL